MIESFYAVKYAPGGGGAAAMQVDMAQFDKTGGGGGGASNAEGSTDEKWTVGVAKPAVGQGGVM